ncbi:beta-glucoside-specific PTS transporter subunit IIABC [Caproiciproducens sp. CPB-2]|uniref:beta-glucoside-specific PTS transporter subunit IIABC n=1 Tax=unclassified Caproiciproducens TaxID=2643836 RepID=UPI0023DBAFC0|nr:beta-glucoside-specific PTS transporter subunit IIABC [Caproiciproducens sp. CPB-2]MDF1494314.1 beta-glucoside-specific PTS transporter subunit IIABC [Caproiciproducens sp. CPB-2]
MKNYKQTAADVLHLVGGKKNVVQLEHCSTRLRFTLVDPAKADTAALKKTPGVMGVISSGPQCQVVIGNDVIEVYNELMKLGDFANGKVVSVSKGGKKNIGGIILDYMVGIFQPLVPAIAGAGVLKAMLTIFTTFGLLTTDMVAYKVFAGVADAALYYLPVLVAFTTANKFNCNKLVAVSLAAAMIHPNTAALLGTEGGAYLFGFKLQSIGYTGQVFPSVLIVMFMASLEHWCNKWCPKVIRIFFVPLLCLAVGFPVGLLVLGPLGYNIGALLTAAILALYNTLGWLAVAIVAAILPFMVSLGMHKALVPYAVSSIASPGFDMLYLPASLAHNIAEGGACLAVALKTKDEKLRSTAISAGISGLFGITEPALYGVTLQHKKVMTSVVASSFVGGLFIGLMKVKAFAAVGPGIASMAMYIDAGNSMNFIWAIVGFVISVVASFVLTLILYRDDAGEPSKEAAPGVVTDSTVCSPLQGKTIPLSEVKDEVFSKEILGTGMAVVPERGELYAPADGTVEQVLESKHAISMVTSTGAELLIHIGVDTVKLEGKGFAPQVKNGDAVKQGQLLMKFDIDAIKAAGYDVTTPIVVTNGDSFIMTPAAEGVVAPGVALMKLEAVK